MNKEYYNPLDKFYKSITGAIPECREITFRVNLLGSVVFVYENDKSGEIKSVPLKNNGSYSECSVSFADGLYWYYFKLPDDRYITEKDLNGIITQNVERKFQLTVYSADFSVPEWIKGGIIYQIFPDRFYSSGKNLEKAGDRKIHRDLTENPEFLPDESGKVKNDDFFGGDLEGITQKLTYLKELGVSAIYLNPVFEAYSNHRYDTGDYLKIDRLLGSEKDLINLINTADKCGIKIILDGVFNHTGDDSVYFNKYGKYKELGAYQSRDSVYYGWYKFIRYPDLYESWWGIDVLPAINKDNLSFTDFIAGENGVLEKYLKSGVYGWRLDVVDELPASFVKKIRSRIKQINPDAVIIGEVWEDASNKISYGVRREYFQGKELDSVMNYPLKKAILNFVKTGQTNLFIKTIKEQTDHYPKIALDALMNILATHDTFRLLSALADRVVTGKSKTEMSEIKLTTAEIDVAVSRLKAAVLLQYTVYGVPSIYYGDEAGMQGYSDPLNRKFFEWGNINEVIRNFFVKIGEIRNTYSCFARGELNVLYYDKECVVYSRTDEQSEILVALNCGQNQRIIKFDGELCELISGKKYSGIVTLNHYEFGIYKKNI